ncbi:MAG: hypothetical protein NTU53_11940, partial [Planctomycetota bacterium]|nr:hypothetical protein [Planctomycetota bacterium]
DAAPMAARALAKVHASHVRGLGRSPLVVAGVAVIPGHRPSHLRGARGRCPTDQIATRLCTYSLNNYLGTRDRGSWSHVYEITKLSTIRKTSESIVFIEENDSRGYNMGGFVEWYPLTVSPGQWVDPVAAWHLGGANFSFADGHVEYWRWYDPRTPKINDFYQSTPNNKDLERLRRGMVTWPNQMH